MTTLLAVLVAGFAGAMARQEAFSALQGRVRTKFPVGILAVNLSGGLRAGPAIRPRRSQSVAALARGRGATGFIGAYTTYSTWAVDSLTLARAGTPWQAALNLAGSMLAGGLLLAWAGASLGSVL